MKPTMLLGALLVLGLSAPAAAAPATQALAKASTTTSAKAPKVDGFTFVRSMGGISEYTLDANGLSVLVMPSHAAPVATVQVTYRVGSRNEVTGSTGGTHLLEHLMFMGSTNFNEERGNSIDTYLESVGAGYNATTSLDRTNYYATLGTNDIDDYIAIEADRMRGLLLREESRQSEMTVVRNEFERGENDPNSALNKLIWATMFQAHPYHHPVIGWRSDIEKVSIEKLRAFYDTYYWPNNATVTVVGDVDTTKVLGTINKYFGKVPRSPKPIPTVYTEEPAQQGARRVTLNRAGESGSVMIAWKAPATLTADAPALSILDLILGEGKSSRLSRALVDTSMASYVGANNYLQHDPAMFTISVAMAPGGDHAKVEATALAEVERIKREGVTAQEIQRALGPYRAEQAYQRDGTDSAASTLNEYIAIGDWTLYETFLQQLEKVTPADVKRVANTYLKADQSTTGWFIPETEK
ncbi:MAG: insulinase family protein [Luteimonas sp.]|nr:insulinase family protein [Luteimonas sp.]